MFGVLLHLRLECMKTLENFTLNVRLLQLNTLMLVLLMQILLSGIYQAVSNGYAYLGGTSNDWGYLSSSGGLQHGGSA